MAVGDYTRWRADQARGYMERIRSTVISVDCRREEIERLSSKLLPAAIAYTEGQSGSVYGDAVPDGIAALDDAISRYRKELGRFVHEIDVARDAVEHVAVPERREMLRLRYLYDMPLRDVCERLGYSYEGGRTLCTYALADLWEHIPDEWRFEHPAL